MFKGRPDSFGEGLKVLQSLTPSSTLIYHRTGVPAQLSTIAAQQDAFCGQLIVAGNSITAEPHCDGLANCGGVQKAILIGALVRPVKGTGVLLHVTPQADQSLVRFHKPCPSVLQPCPFR